MNLDSYIEAVLFLEGEPVKIKKLAEILYKPEKQINEAIEILDKNLEHRGIRLIKKGDEIMLSTAPEASNICEAASKEEFNKDIGKAGLEVLASVVYRGPVSRADIDYIRGVNSSFSLRNLLVRGLVERKTNPKDSRSYLYSPSFKFLQFLGITDIKKLPEYGNFGKIVEQFMEDSKEESAPEIQPAPPQEIKEEIKHEMAK